MSVFFWLALFVILITFSEQCIGTVSCGLALEHNFLGMFHSLLFAGQPLSQ